MNIRELRAALMALSAYRPLLEQPVMAELRRLLDALAAGRGEDAMDAYTAVFYTLRREGYSGLGDLLWDVLRYEESPYAALAEFGGSDPVLEDAARRDVDTLRRLADTECGTFLSAMAALLPE